MVSAASLAVARHQARVMDRQLAAGVWPLAQTFFSNLTPDGRPGVIKFSLLNAGVGPMRIRSVRVAYRDRPVGHGRELLTTCCARGDTAGAMPMRSSYLWNRVVRAGEQVDFLTVTRDPRWRPDVFDALDRAAAEVAVRVCYCSVLDECWVAPPLNAEPEPVQSCAAEQQAPQYR